MKTLASIALATALLGAASTASAQHRGNEWEPEKMGFRVGGEFDIWSATPPNFGNGSVNSFVWGFTGQFAAARTVMIDVDVPWSFTTISPNDFSQAIFGNITVGAHWADKVAPELAIFAGGSLSIPSQLLHPDKLDVEVAAAEAVGSSAFYDQHRWVSGFIPFRIFGGIEWRIIPVLYFRADLTPNFDIKVNDLQRKSYVFIDQSNEIEFRMSGFGVGGRIQEVFLLSDPGFDNNGDKAQLAFEPFVRYEAPHRAGFFARLGLLTAIDPPLGFGFDRGKVATVRLSAGGKW